MKDIAINDWVELAPHYDLWMRGAKYGTVRRIKDGIAFIRMDNIRVRKLARIPVQDLTFRAAR